MTANDFEPDPRQIAPIEASIDETEAGLAVMDAAIRRHIHTVFMNGDRAERRLAGLLRVRGVHAAQAILEDRHPFIARGFIGFMRGSLLNPGVRQRARDSLAELVPLLAQRTQLLARIDDLHRARQTVLERAYRMHIDERLRTRAHVPDRGRARKP